MTTDELVKELNDVHLKLRERLGSYTEVARALQFDESTVRRARRGEGTSATMLKMLDRGRKILTQEPSEMRIPRIVPDSADQKTPPSEPSPSRRARSEDDHPLLKKGGETVGDVPFVITPESYQGIEGFPGHDAVQLTIRFVRMTRGMLNILNQLTDEKTREMVRKKLSVELEELYIAIELLGSDTKMPTLEYMQERRLKNRHLFALLGNTQKKGKR